jgi:hypothetical protein
MFNQTATVNVAESSISKLQASVKLQAEQGSKSKSVNSLGAHWRFFETSILELEIFQRIANSAGLHWSRELQ